ncbi:uncharacterized protein LOC114720996 [Neltuma alba]|uniref:uncharacterized protein LOC114720996 n=1 Tax=Neltuma alba TaxID=207710 RepID=UPI0010A52C4F|nr:uncharacterized protein LOC114720996 [Prosopis alba]
MGRIGCNVDGILDDTKFSQPIPWVGVYIVAASLACLIGMATDTILGICNRKFWFPCKYFSLNATSLTLIGVAVKLSVDLDTSMPRPSEQLAKLSSSALICTIMANSMPSLGAMETKDMFMNLMALAILVITVIVNICMQLGTGVIYVFWREHILLMFLMLILLLLMVSSALTVPTTKQYLEYKYSKKHEMAVKENLAQTEGPITQIFKDKLMKFWMMAHTSSPQFVMGRSPTCTASGAFCLLSAIILAVAMLRSYLMPWSFRFCRGESDYKWSTILILVTQNAAVGVGTIAPALRWFIAIKFRCPEVIKRSSHEKKEFRVETYWIESLHEMKDRPLKLRIPDRHRRKLAHDAKVLFLDFCIRVQKGIVLISKATRIISIFLVSSILACCHHCKILKPRFDKTVSSISSGTVSQPEPKPDLRRFVLHLEGEEALVEVMLKENHDATNHWIRVGEKRKPRHLMQLLEKSSVSQGFKGVGAFDSDKVPSLHPEEPPNSWSLPLVTLTAIAVALPNITRDSVKQLLDTVHEGLHFVDLVENTLDKEGDLIRVRKAAQKVWIRIDLYRKWFGLDLNKLSEKSPEETLQRLADTAKAKYEEFKMKNINVCLRASPSAWPLEVMAANSMYRISNTVLFNCKSKNEFGSETLFEELTLVIADILGSCLVNLPHVLSVKCVKGAIEEREDNVRHAGYIFGKTKKIMEMLERRAFPNLYRRGAIKIDEWRLIHEQNSRFFPFTPSSPENNTETTSSESSDLSLCQIIVGPS